MTERESFRIVGNNCSICCIWLFSLNNELIRNLSSLRLFYKITLLPLRSWKAGKFERMSLTGNSHPIVTWGSRVSRAKQHNALLKGLPVFLNLHGTKFKSIRNYAEIFLKIYSLVCAAAQAKRIVENFIILDFSDLN